MIYLYALCHRDGMDLTGVSGLEGTPLRAVTHGDVAAVVSDHHSLDLTPKEESLWAHESVSERVMRQTSLLPVRFGATYGNEDSLRHVLAHHSRAIEAALIKVSGCVEIGVRMVLPQELHDDGIEIPSGPRHAYESGRDYLMARVRSERRGRLTREAVEAFAQELNGRLGPLVADATTEVRPDARMPLSCAYLVERSTLPSFMERVEALRSEREDVELLVTGPWPPYSFVDLDLTATAGSVS